MCRPRGTVVMKSTVHGAVAIDTAPVIVNEITLVGSRCGRFEPALRMLQAARCVSDDMISESAARFALRRHSSGRRSAEFSKSYCGTERVRPIYGQSIP